MPKRQAARIGCDVTGFVVTLSDSDQPLASAAWSEVQTVLAYKRDLYIVDLICLGLVSANGTVELHEEMEGWSHLVERLPTVLPGTPPMSDWWGRVAKPPFAPCVTTLFKR